MSLETYQVLQASDKLQAAIKQAFIRQQLYIYIYIYLYIYIFIYIFDLLFLLFIVSISRKDHDKVETRGNPALNFDDWWNQSDASSGYIYF